MSRQGMDADTAETVAGVVRLLRRAAELVWRLSTPKVPGRLASCWRWESTWPLTTRNLLPDAISVDGPVPVGDEPVALLRSAQQLLRRIATPGAWTGPGGLRTRVADLLWEANTGVGA